MKQSQTCPKCQSQEIIHVSGKSQKSGYDVGRSVRFGRTNANVAMIDAYICGNCGYVEDWAASTDDLQKIKKKFG